MANIGSEVGRMISWRGKNANYSAKAFERALELLDLTIVDSKNRPHLKELVRLREVLADYFVMIINSALTISHGRGIFMPLAMPRD